METLTSMLLEPSRGSSATMYFDSWFPASMKFSISSEAITQACPPRCRARAKRMSATISSFICSSPCTFRPPTPPSEWMSPARLTSRLMILAARERSASSCESSPRASGKCFCSCAMKRERVVPTGAESRSTARIASLMTAPGMRGSASGASEGYGRGRAGSSGNLRAAHIPHYFFAF